MLLWLMFALFAAAVATLLLRAPNDFVADATTGDDPDAAVYRDQLAELDADVARGVVSEAEAASARTEIARRLLKHVDARPGVTPGATSANATPTRVSTAWFSPDAVLVASVVAVPALSLAVYLSVGSPHLPGRPMTERLAAAPERSSAEDLVAKVEARLRENPGDGMGWSVIAPVLIQQGRYVEAGQAYERAIKLLGETPERLMGLAKALVLANNGMVVDPARAAYSRALALDPKRTEATFWVAIADEQNGRTAEAEATYRRMLADAPADAPWRDAVEARLTGLTAKAGSDKTASSNEAGSNPAAVLPGAPPGRPTAPVGTPSADAATRPQMAAPVLAPASGPKPAGAGPTPAEFVAAAAGMPADMRELMMGRMIARASEIVKTAPKDATAWSRLVTGYKALGKSAEALDALKQARAATAGDRAAQTELEALAKSLGLPS